MSHRSRRRSRHHSAHRRHRWGRQGRRLRSLCRSRHRSGHRHRRLASGRHRASSALHQGPPYHPCRLDQHRGHCPYRQPQRRVMGCHPCRPLRRRAQVRTHQSYPQERRRPPQSLPPDTIHLRHRGSSGRCTDLGQLAVDHRPGCTRARTKGQAPINRYAAHQE